MEMNKSGWYGRKRIKKGYEWIEVDEMDKLDEKDDEDEHFIL